MSRPVIQLHTIEQWFSISKETQTNILKNIKLRDRLWSWLMAREQQKVSDQSESKEGWVPCYECETRGWLPRRPRRLGIHPSALGGSCYLKVFNEATGAPQQVQHEARLQLIFDIGSAAHGMFQGYGMDGAWGPVYKKEVNIGETPLAKSLMIEGHADADNILVIEELPEAIYEVGLVHEYKTINDNGFTNLKNKPMPKHVFQATVYSACLNRPIVVYLYFNKNNANIADFPVPFDSNTWQTIGQRAEYIRDSILSKTAPQANVGFHCKDCGYVFQCEAYLATKKK